MRPELSRPVSAERPPAAVTVTATADELAAVARRLNILAVESLVCRFNLRTQGRAVAAQGALQARVVQECVVTLEPVALPVDEDFVVRFVPEGEETADDDPAAPDEIPTVGGRIDLGEAAVEQLALALDPFPRSPGAGFEPVIVGEDSGEDGPEGPASPFSALHGRPEPGGTERH